MTREEILNTPEIVDFMIDKSVILESKMKLHKRLDELCKLAIKALEQESFINKTCVSSGVCEHDKNKVLDKIRAEIEIKYEDIPLINCGEDHGYNKALEWVLDIIDKYKAESEDKLEQEPCDDCISRQAVLDKAVYTETEEGWSGMTVDVKDIEALPPVKPQEPKTGYWIIEKWNSKEHYSCSSCQHVVDYEPCYHYCPYCGSKMIEVRYKE